MVVEENAGQVSGEQTSSESPAQQTSADVSSVVTDTPDVSEEPKADSASAADASGSGAQGSAGLPDYKVNPEFVTFGEKKKFDDWALPYIKDAETETKFRELFQAKYSIDRVKQKRDEYQAQLNETAQAYGHLERRVGRLSGYLEQGDLAAFQREAKLPDEAILMRAKQILDAQQNPALKAAEDQRYAAHARAVELEEQNSFYQSQIQGEAVSRRTAELDQTLARPDVSQVAASFDARAGKIGAFRDEIIRRGIYHATVNNRDVPVEQILQELSPLFQLAAQAPAAPTPVVAAQPSAGLPPSKPQERKPVIPNVQGRGTSPTKKVFKSLDELRAKAADLARSNQP